MAEEVTHASPTPIVVMIKYYYGLKLVKAVAGLGNDSGECIKLASMTPGNTEYPKHDPIGAQNSHDALAKVSFVYSSHSAKT
jgi:hypothetical protein